uniref:DUF3846 domain-containing protein n=1 Tax=Syphacia muris TaxID=451379 RepID=A0A0N5AUZ0_9BILA
MNYDPLTKCEIFNIRQFEGTIRFTSSEEPDKELNAASTAFLGIITCDYHHPDNVFVSVMDSVAGFQNQSFHTVKIDYI